MNDRGRLHRIEDLGHRVPDRQDVAGGVLQSVAFAGVHQRRRVGDEVAVYHHVVERLGDLSHRRRATAVATLARGDRDRDPPAHLLRCLDHLAILAEEIPLPKYAERGLGPLADFRWAGLRRHAGYLLYLVVTGNIDAVSRARQEK
jgi:hypothetical protein